MPLLFLTLVAFLAVSCARENPTNAPDTTARSVLLITVDTLRADRVGAYGYGRARTPVMDSLAARGARFTHAFAPAPITLTSHASLMTGRYPPGHGARHNGMRLAPDAVTLAESLSQAGMATGAFVGAFPLDRRFGLDQGFTAYGDTLPRGPGGRVQNERAGRLVVDEALAWLATARPQRFFLWVHLFEPHAPYGNPADARPARDRYDDEVAEVDRQIGRVIGALGDTAASTLVIVTADHGEAFGEHGEIGHSIFVYDTTLRIPLIVAGPSVKPGVVDTPVSLVDLAPTIARRLNTSAFDADGVDLSPALEGGTIGSRPLYAESFAPLLDFGWSPLRSLRADGYKYIAAPKPELYALENDPGEHENLVAREAARAAVMQDRVQRISSARLPQPRLLDADAAARLQALGYASGGPDDDGRALADPKDRRDLAARIAQVTSGELSGAALETTLRSILAEDPRNPQAHLRLGYVLHDTGRCPAAEPHFRAAIAAKLPGTDAHLGLAACRVVAQRPADAVAILTEAAGIEPGNPVVLANLGGVLSDSGQPRRAVEPLRKALSLDPDLHQGRFMLAIALARAGDRAAAARETQELLRRLPADAPQRAEVERLQSALQ
ncbi:MAG TPA: sulfatase-like hydrolase/transferase [Vicinamibacterales bacterium]|nr:sulfatase-like hydrolase/transferase [Vicinamibacterales bacterium]